ncbi:MAG: hypothetical protein K2X35_23565 [Bryobacteraceae bacterium]|nr:hypothetical protein [Bryobacteraceae bacterium]
MNSGKVKVCVIALTIALSALAGRTLYSQQNRPRPVALTAIVREYFAKGPGVGFSKVEYKVLAIRGDGSTAEFREVLAPDGKVAIQQMIMDLRSGQRRLFDGLTDSRTTYEIPRDTLERSRVARKVCEGTDESTLVGTRTAKEVLHQQHGSRKITITTYRAPEWDCLALKEVFETEGEDGKAWVTNLREVVSVSLGEPESKWFELPAAAVERSPSAVLQEYARRYPDYQITPKTGRILDDNYRKFQTK